MNANGKVTGSNIGNSYRLRLNLLGSAASIVFKTSGLSLSMVNICDLPQTDATNFSSSNCSMNLVSSPSKYLSPSSMKVYFVSSVVSEFSSV